MEVQPTSDLKITWRMMLICALLNCGFPVFLAQAQSAASEYEEFSEIYSDLPEDCRHGKLSKYAQALKHLYAFKAITGDNLDRNEAFANKVNTAYLYLEGVAENLENCVTLDMAARLDSQIDSGSSKSEYKKLGYIPLPDMPDSPEVIAPADAGDYVAEFVPAGSDKRWMAKNLNIEVGDSVCYSEDPENCSTYGRLYTWRSARQACQIMGGGWHLPSDKDWDELLGYNAPERHYDRGGHNKPNEGAFEQLSETKGFNGQFGGKRIYFPDNDAYYSYDLATIGYYWTDGRHHSGQYRIHTLRATDRTFLREGGEGEDYYSVRCVRDN